LHRLNSLYLNLDRCQPTIKLTENEAHYVKNVLRLSCNDELILYTENSKGFYKIKNVSKKYVEIELIKEKKYDFPFYEFIVIQSLMKREYLDTVVEKYGELGVTKVILVKSENSVVKLENKTLERLRKLLINGAMQAGYNFLPELYYFKELKDIIVNTDEKICFYEKVKEKNLPDRIAKSVAIFIGPEGGFSESDLLILKDKGFNFLSPINGILKAETAGVVFAGLIKSYLDCGKYV